MAKNNRKCVICGKEYKFCHSCNTTNQPTWRVDFCDENCREIYHVCVDFKAGKLTKDEALKKINNCDLSEFNKYTKSTKSIIREIQANIKKTNTANTFKRKK